MARERKNTKNRANLSGTSEEREQAEETRITYPITPPIPWWEATAESNVIPVDAGESSPQSVPPVWAETQRGVNWRSPYVPGIIDLDVKKHRTGSGTRIVVFRIGDAEVFPDGEGTNVIEARHLICDLAFSLKQLTLAKSVEPTLAKAVLNAGTSQRRWLRVIASERGSWPDFLSQPRLLELQRRLMARADTTSSLVDEVSGITLQILSDAEGESFVSLTKQREMSDPLQVREEQNRKENRGALRPLAGSKASAQLEDFKVELDHLQEPLEKEIELFLHRLPSIKFTSLEEKKQFEKALGNVLSRLGKRIVRYDVEKKVPLDDEPSLLRCATIGDGYFRLEYFRDGTKHRTGIGSTLPPLSLAPIPSDARKRPK